MAGRDSGGGGAPDHRVELERSSGRVRVLLGGVVVADSRRALRVTETGHDPVLYLPAEDVRLERARRTTHHSFCPFKGAATYWSFQTSTGVAENVAWSYEEPLPQVEDLRGHLAFYADRAEVRSDDADG